MSKKATVDTKEEISTAQVVNLLLSKEVEVSNKFHHAVNQLIMLGYKTSRGKEEVKELLGSVHYSLEEIERILFRWSNSKGGM